MRDFAGLDVGEPGISFESLPGVAHQSSVTQPMALEFLLDNRPL